MPKNESFLFNDYQALEVFLRTDRIHHSAKHLLTSSIASSALLYVFYWQKLNVLMANQYVQNLQKQMHIAFQIYCI